MNHVSSYNNKELGMTQTWRNPNWLKNKFIELVSNSTQQLE